LDSHPQSVTKTGKIITQSIFALCERKLSNSVGKYVEQQYGKGRDGFNISSCQFALHYFFETQNVLQNFMRNLAECTKIGGYFIGACYDGKTIFNLLKNKEKGGSIELYHDKEKVWQVKKEYSKEGFEDDVSSVGYKIEVYQESINKMFPEYLVNFDYLHRIMENYGFKMITREEAKEIGLPEGSGMFGELFNNMLDEVKRDKFKKNEYGHALEMNSYEKKISFLNRYFVYKKLRNVNAEKVAMELMEEENHNDDIEVEINNIQKKKKVSFDDILSNMNLVVNQNGVLQSLAPLQQPQYYQEQQQPYQPQDQQQQPYQQLN
jgi:hypothetical protein